ncbi:MAG: glycosyltransferase family 4 protein, partial [Alphaproteobacteria bacterium]|nr:glycosyltransferase family 4 protein [Alphaproteobacteria bacterium]
FGGEYHASTFPSWLNIWEKVIIPLGLPDIFCDAAPVSKAPASRAIFVSNPLRGLDWLLDLWEKRIKPYAPEAEIHVFSGATVYNLKDEKKNQQMKAVLEKAEKMADAGVKIRTPVMKTKLLEEMQKSRVLLYRGDINETFCLAVGEAQAAGVPAVVKPIGSVTERVVHGLTGIVADDDEAFAQAAVKLLTDDDEWHYMKNGAIATQRDWRWDNAAEAFEMLIPKQ